MPTFLERIKARRFSAASSSAVSIGVNGESESRLDVDAGGKLLWGSGSATGDTNLYRSAADTLKTDDAFTAASLAVTGQFTLPTADGTSNQVLVTNGSGTVSWANQTGGSGSPGGSDGQVQYNNGGVFGGASSLYYNDANGRVGIGTTSPSQELHVYTGAANADVRVQGDATGYMDLYHGPTVAGLHASNGVTMRFATNNTNRMFIDSSGNVGIGVESPNRNLHVQQASSGATAYGLTGGIDIETDNISGLNILSPNTGYGRIYFGSPVSNTAGAVEYIHNATATSGYMKFRAGAADRVFITGDGKVGIGTSTPDETLDVSGNLQITGTALNLKGTGNYPNAVNFYTSGTEGYFWHLTGPRELESHSLKLYWYNGSAYSQTVEFATGGAMTVAGNITTNGDIYGTSDTNFYIGNDSNERILFQESSNQLFFMTNGTWRAYYNSSGHYLPYADSTYDLGGSSIRWRNAYTDSLTTGTATVTLINHSTTSSFDKIRVWNSSSYSIGMVSGRTFGHLGDYAMTFRMNNDSDRGFWWGDTSHTASQGAMSLTTNGRLTVATSLSVGQGEGVTAPSTTTLYVNGDITTPNVVTANEFRATDVGPANDASFTFSGDEDTGLYRHATNQPALTAAGVLCLIAAGGTVNTAGLATTTTSGYQYVLRNNTYGTLYRYSSTAELKENITNVTDANAGAWIDALQPVTFVERWLQEGEESAEARAFREADIQVGFIAEDVYANAASAQFAQVEDNDGVMKPVGWKWECVIAAAVAEIKSLRARVATLESA